MENQENQVVKTVEPGIARESTNPMAEMPGEDKKGSGVVIAVIVIIVLAFVAWFMFAKNDTLTDDSILPPTSETNTTEQPDDAITQSINAQSQSDDLGDIEADLNATNIDTLDQ